MSALTIGDAEPHGRTSESVTPFKILFLPIPVCFVSFDILHSCSFFFQRTPLSIALIPLILEGCNLYFQAFGAFRFGWPLAVLISSQYVSYFLSWSSSFHIAVCSTPRMNLCKADPWSFDRRSITAKKHRYRNRSQGMQFQHWALFSQDAKTGFYRATHFRASTLRARVCSHYWIPFAPTHTAIWVHVLRFRHPLRPHPTTTTRQAMLTPTWKVGALLAQSLFTGVTSRPTAHKRQMSVDR